MFNLSKVLLAASAVFIFSGAAGADDKVLYALNIPAKTAITFSASELKSSATAQIKLAVPGYSDFDALSSVNDPLYREGSKELLKQFTIKEGGKKDSPKQTLRDAPISKDPKAGAVKPVKAGILMKKIKSVKPLHGDPIKVKDTF